MLKAGHRERLWSVWTAERRQQTKPGQQSITTVCVLLCTPLPLPLHRFHTDTQHYKCLLLSPWPYSHITQYHRNGKCVTEGGGRSLYRMQCVDRTSRCSGLPTDHGVEGELLDPLLVVGHRSPTERHRGVEGRQAGPEPGSKGRRVTLL